MDKWLPYEFQALKRVRGLGAGLYVQTKNVLCTFQALKRVRSLGAANAESAGHRHKLKFQALKREHGHLAGKISIRGLSPKHVSSPQAGTRPVSPNGEYSPYTGCEVFQALKREHGHLARSYNKLLIL